MEFWMSMEMLKMYFWTERWSGLESNLGELSREVIVSPSFVMVVIPGPGV
jgi:hypothetical protein